MHEIAIAIVYAHHKDTNPSQQLSAHHQMGLQPCICDTTCVPRPPLYSIVGQPMFDWISLDRFEWPRMFAAKYRPPDCQAKS